MAVSKVILDGSTLLDVTNSTVNAQRILSGYTAKGADGVDVTGAYVPPTFDTQAKSVTPSESQQTVTPDSGYDGLSSVTVGAVSSTYVGSGITRRSSTDLTASGATVTVPSGYYSAQASKAVSSGTAGTPTATKGSVSNHSLSVTPSVTNATGYITGGTVSGTAVSVSASELVSGTLNITSSGTKDVTNYASASVAAGSATASATKGSVTNHSVTVTPSVTRTAGYVTAGTADGTAVTVSASELVSGSQTITENGTVDVTNLASVDVDVQASGGSSYTLVYSTTLTVSTTSTSATIVGTIETGDSSIWTSGKMVYVKIRDAAGWRNGYFYGMDAFLANNSPTIGATASYAWFGRGYSMTSNYMYPIPPLAANTTTNTYPQGYGVYPTHLYDDGSIQFMARYSSSTATRTQTIDGTFSVDVYLLDWPGGASPYSV